MRVSTDRAALSAALRTAQRLTLRRNPTERIAHMHTERSRLVLSGNDPELSYRVHVHAVTHHAGSLALDPDPLRAAIDATPDGAIELTHQHSSLHIDHPQHRATLTLDPSQAPNLTDFPALVHDTIASYGLKRAIDSVRSAASNEPYRGAMSTIRIEARERFTRFIATDGLRLALYDAPPLPALTRDRLIDPQHLDALRHLSDPHDTLLIGYAHPHLHIVTPSGELLIRTRDGQFPEYLSAIPPRSNAPIVVDATQLRAAIARVSILNQPDPSRRITITHQPPHLHLRTSGAYGSAHETLTAHSDTIQLGGSLHINSAYLRDALAPVRSSAELHQPTDPTRPLMIRDRDDPNYLAVLVPLTPEETSS